MKLNNSGSVRVSGGHSFGKLKGFTLIELIVVMAIIAILAGISSIIINGFQRDARMEADNNKAQMLYTGFQNIMIQCEINQDMSLFDIDALSASPLYSGQTNPADNKPLTYARAVFTMYNADIQGGITVAGFYGNDNTKNKMATLSSGNKGYAELRKAILSEIDASFEGTAAVYINIEDYTVDSAVYYESAKDFTDHQDSTATMVKTSPTGLKGYLWEKNDDKKGKIFQSFFSRDEQREAFDDKGVHCGAYPYMNDAIMVGQSISSCDIT